MSQVIYQSLSQRMGMGAYYLSAYDKLAIID